MSNCRSGIAPPKYMTHISSGARQGGSGDGNCDAAHSRNVGGVTARKKKDSDLPVPLRITTTQRGLRPVTAVQDRARQDVEPEAPRDGFTAFLNSGNRAQAARKKLMQWDKA